VLRISYLLVILDIKYIVVELGWTCFAAAAVRRWLQLRPSSDDDDDESSWDVAPTLSVSPHFPRGCRRERLGR
jgi:hypothetical protein